MKTAPVLLRLLVLVIFIIPVAAGFIKCTGQGQITPEMAKQGEQLFYSGGCDKCHSLKGEGSLYGPPLDSILNKEIVVIRQGEKTIIKADREYITRSITHPETEKLEGYSGKTMPQAFLSDGDIRKIVDFIVYLNSDSNTE